MAALQVACQVIACPPLTRCMKEQLICQLAIAAAYRAITPIVHYKALLYHLDFENFAQRKRVR